MTAILSILADAWPFVLAAVGVLFGLFRHQQARTAAAEAKQKEAEADAHVARNDAAAAQVNQAGAQAGADNAKVRRDEDSVAAAEPDSSRVLHEEWGNEGRN